ncbi:MAG TPA: restriction endonuclease subunit S [Ignavibacteria bacterium]
MEKLIDHIKIEKGKLPKNLSDIKSDKFCFPYVDIKAFEKGNIVRYTDGEKCVICEKDDILIVWDGARCGFAGKAIKGAVGSTLSLIRPQSILNKNYLFYFLKSQFIYFNTNVKGVGIPHLNPELLHNSLLTIPSLEIQKLIVEKIEELFSELDSGVEELKKVREQLKVYRQSVLNAAFTGKLTEKWRNQQNKDSIYGLVADSNKTRNFYAQLP